MKQLINTAAAIPHSSHFSPLHRAAGVMRPFRMLMVGFWLVTTGLAWGAALPDSLINSGPNVLSNTLAQIAMQEKGRGDYWEFQQRAYPLGYIPLEPITRARTQVLAAQQQAFKETVTRKGGTSPKILGIGQAQVNFYNVGPAPINGGQTEPPSPVSGRITDIAIAPDNANHWLVGTAQGGVWETYNAGGTWSPLTDQAPSLAVGAVAFAPGNSQIIYVGTGEGNSSDSAPGAGLLKSTDGGVTWTLVNATNFYGRGFTALCVDPNNPNNVVASTTAKNGFGRGNPTYSVPSGPPTGVYYSTDGGTSWSRPITGNIADLVAAPGNFSVQYCGGYTGQIFVSTNGGGYWTGITGPWNSLTNSRGRVALAFSPADPNVLFVSIEDSGAADPVQSLGIWRTTGALSATPTWTQLPAPPAANNLWYSHVIAVDPLDSRILYFGEEELWKFDGSGSGGVPSGIWSNISTNLHSDMHALKFPTTGRLVCGCDGGVNYSDNRGAVNWVDCNTTLSLTAFYFGAIHPTAYPSMALGGEQDNGSSRWTGSQAWTWIGYGDGGEPVMGDNVNHQAVNWNNLQLYRYMTGGIPDNFTNVYAGITDRTNASLICRVRRNPSNENEIITGTDHLWRTDNFFSSAPGQPTWYSNSPRLGSGVYITAIAFAPSDTTGNAYAYGTSDGRLAITYDGGATWLNLDRNDQVPDRYITQLAFDPQNSAKLYVTVSGFDEGTPSQPGHVFYTDYAYAEQQGNPVPWTNISPPVDLPADAIAVDPADPKVIYVGTDIGMWRCWDAHTGASTNWEQLGLNTGMPNVGVYDLQFHAPTRRLFAFTHGRGLFITDLVPGNDNVATAEAFSDTSGTRAGSTVNATHEVGEPNHASAGGTKSVWFMWTPTSGGMATVDTIGSAFGAVLAVYAPGTSWNGLAFPALVSDNGSAGGGASRVTFQVARNQTYYIAIDGAAAGLSGAFSLNYSIAVDNVAPTVAFTPLTDNETVFDLSQIGGTINEAGTVKFRIWQYDASGNNDLYWNGSSWIANGNDPSVYLAATVTGGTWAPAGGVTLPSRGQTRYGPYFLRAVGTDFAGNSATNDILVTRSATDTTPPLVTLDYILNGTVFTNQVLPGLSGSALDNESGITSVQVHLYRFSGGSPLYWDGSSWSANPATLSVTYNPQTVAWQVNSSLPSGVNLPNGGYGVEIYVLNGEAPALNKDLIVNFSVDYHPVYVFNYGSQFTVTPNMKWDSPDNWDVGSEPTPDARVVINGYSPDSSALGVVQVYELDMSGGYLNTAGILIQKLNLSGGEVHGVNGAGLTLTNNGTSVWSGGNLTFGTLTVLGGSTLILTNNNVSHDIHDCILTNYGSVVWSGGPIHGGGGSPGTLIYNYGLWDVQCDQAWTFNDYQGYGSVFNNYGIFRKSVGATNNQTTFLGGVYLNQLAGVLDVQQGTLGLQGSASFTGGYTTTNTTGTLLLISGDYNVNGTVTSTNVVENGGHLAGANVINGALTWLGGVWNGATVTVTSNSTVYLASSANMDMANTIVTNYGRVLWSSGSIHGGGGSPGTFIYNYGLWDVQCDQTWTFNDYQGYGTVFNNYATLRKSAGTNGNQTLFPSGVYLNQLGGVLDVQQGTFSLQGSASFLGGYVATNTTGTLLLAAGGYNLNGTVTGTNVVQNGGNLVGANFINGALTWLGGVWNGATVSVTPNSTVYLASSANMDMANTIVTNNGRVLWSSGAIHGGGFSPGTLVYNYGLWDVQCDQMWTWNDYQGNGTTFNNYATLRKSVGATNNQTLFPNGVFLNQLGGVLDIQQGTLGLQGGASFAGGYTTTNTTGTVLLAAGGYNLNGTVTSTNVVENGGSLVGANFINGALTWLGGVWNGATVSVTTNSTVYLASSANMDMANTIVTNNGRVLWSSGSIHGGGFSPGTLVYNYGLWDVQCDQTWTWNDYQGNGTTFNNYATLRKSVGANGNQTLFLSGVYLNQLGGVLDVQQGTLGLQGGASFAGGYTTTNTTGTVLLAAGGYNLNGTVTSSNVVENGGSLVGANFINGALTWLGGIWNGATVTVTTNSTVYLASSANMDMANTIVTNNGRVLWSSGSIHGGSSPGTFVYNYGVWDVQCDQVWTWNDYQGNGTVFNNYGTFRKSAGTNSSQTVFLSGVSFNQLSGILDVQFGNFSLQGAANFAGGYVTTNNTGTTILSGGSFTLVGGLTSSNVVENGGVPVGNNVIRGALTWLSGNWNGTAMTVASNSTFYMAGGANLDVANATITNNGTVLWNSGYFQGGGGSPGTFVYNYGLWDIRCDQVWTWNAYQGNGTVFNNYATLRKSVGTNSNQTLFFSGVYLNQLSGMLDVQQGNFNLQGGANFAGGFVTTNNTGTTILSGGGFTFNGGLTSSNVVENGGVPVGNNVIRGALTWLSGNWNGVTMTVASNSTFYMAGGGNLDVADATLTNNGTVLWSSGYFQGGGGSPGTLVYNYGLWDVQCDQVWNFNAYQGNGTVFNNFGTFRKEGSVGTTTFTPGSNFNNPGTVDLRSGMVAFNGAVYTSPTSKLNLVISGPGAGTQFGSESFGYPPPFDGTLGITLTNGFVPTNGSSFVIATYPSSTGQFSSIQFPPLPAISKWQLTYNPTSLALQVVPSTAFLSSSLTNRNFQFTFVGQTGSSCLIEASTNLLNWTPLVTNTPFTGTLNFVDPQTPQFRMRFYRATVFP